MSLNANVYTLVVSGERFELTKDQLESDPGNYFQTYFLGEFQEAANGVKELTLHKEPKLFKLIQAHLRGYEVIPLSDTYVIPDYMTRETAIQSLLNEALYYGLAELQGKIERWMQKRNEEEEEVGRKRKAYKLAKVNRHGTWSQHEISESGFQLIRSHLGARPNINLRIPLQLEHQGFKLVICWQDGNGPDNRDFALLESKD
ncbi:hypothetical protein CPB86DRAFT_834587 [Serendipita vermifera]|nr:hypothetical protein CPB86DRAFT_834587 [Serendipita vermifera]